MKKNLTLLFLSLCTFLFLGSSLVNAQTEVWTKSYTWNADRYYRGLAYSSLNNYLYVAGTEGAYTGDGVTFVDDNKIQILNAATGDSITTISPESAMGGDWGYGIRNVEVDMEGGIYATIGTSNQWNPVQLYYWSSIDADPILLWKDASGTADDFGGSFSVYGSLSDEALIIIPFVNVARVYYFEVVNGDIGIVNTLDLTGLGAIRTPSVQALGTKISDGFYYNNVELSGPVKFDGTGNIVAQVPAEVFDRGTNGDVKHFMAGTNEFLCVSDSGDVQIIDITGKAADLSDVTAGDAVKITGTAPIHVSIWPHVYGDGQEQIASGNPDGSYAIYTLSGGQYIKAFATEGAPTASALKLSGSPLVGEVKTAEYTYIDINGDAEATSEIKWYVADDALGTNIAEITANAGNMTYTLDAMDAGKYISFTLLPIAATGTVSDPLHLATSEPFGPVLTEETAPVASNAAITGANEVGVELTASYDFSDAGGDVEGDSDYKWFQVDDNTGTNPVEIAAGSLNYTIQEADAGKYIMFVVTPASETGWPLVGEADTAYTDATILFLPAPPVASDVAISGRQAVEAILSGSYTYSDVNGDEEHSDGSIQNWWSADTTAAGTYGGDTIKVATDTNQYELQASDYRRIIWYEVIPVSVPTDGVDTGLAVIAKTDTIAARPADYPPKAEDVVILSGIPEVGVLISGSYVYKDTIVNDPEGESIYKWYVADDAAGTNATEIAGANKQSILVTEEHIGKHFIFEVTPVAQTGGLLVGETVQSSATADAAIASTNTYGLERMWVGSTLFGSVPHYLSTSGSILERGIAVGTDHIYVASRDGGTRVFMVDKTDGSYVGELSTIGIESTGATYSICDIEISDDGQILAAPLIVGATDFWIYKWENESAEPVKWLEITGMTEPLRLGDKFTVTGDVSGNAIIMAVAGGGNQIVRWVVTGGIPAEPEIITLNNITSTQLLPAAIPFTLDANSNILVSAKGFNPTVYTSTGDSVSTIYGIDDYAASGYQASSPNIFDHKGRTMAAFYQAQRTGDKGARIIVADITAEPYQIVDTSEIISNGDIWYGEVDLIADVNYYHAFILSPTQGIGYYRGELVLPEFVSAQTNYEGTMIYTVLDKTLNEITEETNAAPWTITADAAGVSIDSIWSGSDSIYFELSAAITEGQVVTISYDGTGTIASFNGMPLAAFGPETVLNIVGADVPVATDVTVNGTPNEGETLTGTYTFNDPDGDAEGASEYQWWEATDASGTGALKLIGQTTETYTIGTGMVGKFVAFEVTPVSATGGDDYLVGEPAMSAWVEIVEPTNSVEESFATKINTYPNPVQHVLNITNTEEITRISIIDISGKTLLTVDNSSKENKVSIPMSEFNSGMYFVNLTGDNGQIAVKRIIKN